MSGIVARSYRLLQETNWENFGPSQQVALRKLAEMARNSSSPRVYTNFGVGLALSGQWYELNHALKSARLLTQDDIELGRIETLDGYGYFAQGSGNCTENHDLAIKCFRRGGGADQRCFLDALVMRAVSFPRESESDTWRRRAVIAATAFGIRVIFNPDGTSNYRPDPLNAAWTS